jgi:hypothetical protein
MLASGKFEELLPRLVTSAKAFNYRTKGGEIVPVELFQAGEFGPVKLSEDNTFYIGDLRFLTPTEFVRAKVKAWQFRRSNNDARDIAWVLKNVTGIQVNRINPDCGLDDLASTDSDVMSVWESLSEEQECGEDGTGGEIDEGTKRTEAVNPERYRTVD